MKGVGVAVALILSLSGCCTSGVAPMMLPIPPQVTYPLIAEQELVCLKDETFNKLRDRDVMCRARNDTLESIIRATHK